MNADELQLDGTDMHAYNEECDKGEIILKPWYFTGLNDFFHDDESESLFDDDVQQLMRQVANPKVISVDVRPCGDLLLVLEQQVTISITITSADSEPEMWRFLSSEEAPHLICSANTFLESEMRR